MSLILDRMIKRAQGVLPAVQPLLTSRPSEPGAGIEVAEQSETRNDARIRSSRTTADEKAGTRVEPGQLIPPKQIANKPAGRPDPAPAREFKLNAEAARPASAGEGSTIFEVGSPFSAKAQNHFDQAAAKPSEDALLAKARADDRGTLAREEKLEGLSEQRSATREPARMHAETTAAPAEEHTEIHISIGSVELRAPRAEARQRPAPFRPRVTLDEFLRRKPGPAHE